MPAFEVHLTINPTNGTSTEALEEWAKRCGLKFTHIELQRGETRSQPMVTRHGRGTLATALEAAAEDSAGLATTGLAVMRVKIEIDADDEAAPSTESAATMASGQYFEAHVKLLLEGNRDLSALTALANRHAGHVSRNARRVRSDHREERFVTQRGFGVGRDTSQHALDALLSDLRTNGFAVLQVEHEFVVYDSNLKVDAGWM